MHETDGSWTDVGQVKKTEAKDRANLRWGDISGNGRANMIWVDQITGNGEVWYNDGLFTALDVSGSAYKSTPMGKQFEGSVAGTCEYFPDLDGGGRAHMHSILGTWSVTLMFEEERKKERKRSR